LDNLFFGLSISPLGPTMLDSSGATAAIMVTGSPSEIVIGNWAGTLSHAVVGGSGITFFGGRDSFATPTQHSTSADLIGSDPLTHFGQNTQLVFGK
jgi:hypothetical protein